MYQPTLNKVLPLLTMKQDIAMTYLSEAANLELVAKYSKRI